MKTILVPTDFSREADHALQVATAIARKTGAEIVLEHIIQTAFEAEYTTATNLPKAAKENIEFKTLQAQKKLHKKIKPLQAGQVRISTEARVGNLSDELPQIIASHKVDLIVMGTSGASGWEALIGNSNTAKVVRYARCMVLTVGKKITGFDIKNLVLAVDFKQIPADFISKLREWQALFGFTIHLLYVNAPLNFTTTLTIEKRMNKFLKDHPLASVTPAIFCDYSQQDGIINYAQKVNADVIAMLTHGRNGIMRLLDGSVTENVVNQSQIPVLTYHLSS
jgi:nucleotide-binding universal stress UspA family protein